MDARSQFLGCLVQVGESLYINIVRSIISIVMGVLEC